jgi:hypothetical protein
LWPHVTGRERIFIRKRKNFGRKRKFKRISNRKLSLRDIAVLDFLWTWKVATIPMLGEVAYKGKSIWWVYKALRQLQKERYIQLLPRGRNLEQELWALTDHGFEIILMDRDDIVHYRYKPHAPAHDYLGSCLQLGDLWQFPCEKIFFTEQMLASLAPSNFPKGFKNHEGHVPDGITILRAPLKEAIIGYEVDLNLKDTQRYESTFEYYYNVKPTLLFWLVRNTWMADKILEVGKVRYGGLLYGDDLLSKICFVLVDEFKEKIWEAQVLNGKYKGVSLRKLHANLLQNLGKDTANFGQKSLKEIFFPKFKSPQKSVFYEKQKESEIC